jgi:hypothetical protein
MIDSSIAILVFGTCSRDQFDRRATATGENPLTLDWPVLISPCRNYPPYRLVITQVCCGFDVTDEIECDTEYSYKSSASFSLTLYRFRRGRVEPLRHVILENDDGDFFPIRSDNPEFELPIVYTVCGSDAVLLTWADVRDFIEYFTEDAPVYANQPSC